MKKRMAFFSALLMLFVVASPWKPAAAAATVPTVSVDSVTALAGQTVDVKVRLENNPGLSYMVLQVNYGEGLTLLSAKNGTVLSGYKAGSNITKKPYAVSWDHSLNTATGNGVILTLTFAVDSRANGTIPITLSYREGYVVDGNVKPVTLNLKNGQIQLPAVGLVSAVNTAKGPKITWKAYAGAQTYEVMRKTVEGSWETLTQVADLSYVDTSAAIGTSYQYTVRAMVKGYATGYHATGLFATYKMLTPAKATAPYMQKVTGSTVTFGWKPVAEASGYQIYSGAIKRVIATVSGTSFTAKNLKAGTVYPFQVRAYIKYGSQTTYGAWSSATTFRTVPGKMATPKFTQASVNAVTFTWPRVSGASGYQIYSGAARKVIATTTGTSFTAKNLKATTNYAFQVRAFVKNGNTVSYGAWSNAVITRTTPGTAAKPTLKAGKKQLTASWKKTSGASGYQVMVSSNKNFSGAKTVTVSGTKTTVKSLTRKKTYYVRIRAYTTLGKTKLYGAWSSTRSVKVK